MDLPSVRMREKASYLSGLLPGSGRNVAWWLGTPLRTKRLVPPVSRGITRRGLYPPRVDHGRLCLFGLFGSLGLAIPLRLGLLRRFRSERPHASYSLADDEGVYVVGALVGVDAL